MLAQHEEKISELYFMFAKAFPEYADFWDEIASEEVGHADLIRSLKEHVGKDEFLFSIEQFTKEAIQSSIIFVEKKIESMKKGEMSIVKALVLGMDMENALIEKAWFKEIDTSIENIRNAFKQIQQETENHSAKMKELFLKIKQN